MGQSRKIAGNRIAGYLDVLAMAALLLGPLAVILGNRAGVIGLYNDDAMYAVAGRLLAEGSDPSRTDLTTYAPLQRFPIGFPLMLAGFWRVVPNALLVVPLWETLVAVFTAVFLLASYWLLTRAWDVNRWSAAAAVGLVAFHPLTVKYGSAVMSDLVFAAFAAGNLALVEWVRRRPGQALPALAAGVAFGLTTLVRYAALAPALATGLVLLLERRLKALEGIAATAALVVAPWAWWVVHHRLYGYADQYFHHARERTIARSLVESVQTLFFQSLGGLVAPGIFLPELGTPTWPALASWSPRSAIGAGVALFLLLATAKQLRRPDRRLPALYALITVALVALWAGRFPELAWDLQVRMLLPVAPFLVAFTFDEIREELVQIPKARRAVLAALGGAAGLYSAVSIADIDRRITIQTPADGEFHLQALLSAKSYILHLPKDVRLGTFPCFQAYFYLDRPFYAVAPTPADLLEARDAGVRVILATPSLVRGHDWMHLAVKDLMNRKPPLARVLYAPSDYIAVVHLPADPLHPPEVK